MCTCYAEVWAAAKHCPLVVFKSNHINKPFTFNKSNKIPAVKMFPTFLESHWDYLFVNWTNKTSSRNNNQAIFYYTEKVLLNSQTDLLSEVSICAVINQVYPQFPQSNGHTPQVWDVGAFYLFIEFSDRAQTKEESSMGLAICFVGGGGGGHFITDKLNLLNIEDTRVGFQCLRQWKQQHIIKQSKKKPTKKNRTKKPIECRPV